MTHIEDGHSVWDSNHSVLRGIRLSYHDTLVRLSMSYKVCFTEASRLLRENRLTLNQRDESLNPIHR